MFVRIRRAVLFLMAFAVPIQGFSVLDFGLPTTPFKLATAGLLVIGGLQLVSGTRPARDSKLPWLLAFAVAFMVGATQGFLRGIPVPALVGMSVTVLSLITFYVLLGFVVLKREDLVLVLWGLVLGGVFTAAPAVLGFQQASSGGRYRGLSGQENLLGIDMIVVIPIAVALLMVNRAVTRKAVLGGAAGIALLGLLMSLSRTAFVSGLAMWGLWVYRSRRIDTIKYVFPALAVFVGVVFLAPENVTDRIGTITDPRRRSVDSSIQSRLHQAEFAVKAIASNPLLGIGVLSFRQWVKEQRGGRVVTHDIHNAYLRVAVAQGFLGLIPYLMLLYLSWHQYGKAWRLARSRRALKDPLLSEYGLYALFMQMALFGTMVSGLAAHTYESKSAWMLMGLSPVVLNLVTVRVEELIGEPRRGLVEDPHAAVPHGSGAWSR